MPKKTAILDGATADAVAAWMLSELDKQRGVLYQEDAVAQIAERFGEPFVYDNPSGNPAIHKTVLVSFRKLTGNSVVWSRGDRLWRRREAGDESTGAKTEKPGLVRRTRRAIEI